MRLSTPAVLASSTSRLLLAAAVLSLALLPAGCFRSRMLNPPKGCPPGDPACGTTPDKRDAAADGNRDGRPGGDSNLTLDGPRDGKRDVGGGNADLRVDGKADTARDTASDGNRDLRFDGVADRPRDAYVCLAVETCGNGVDDDCNGLADCYDRACMNDPSCIDRKKETCDNGIDDDGNGFVDCKDPACFGDKACAVPGKEICNNNLDDDNDTLIDCKDADCAKDPTCVATPGEEICDNGKDDNGDGFADCTDPKCTTFPACLLAACAPDVDFGTIASSGATVARTLSTVGATAGYATCASPGGVARVGSFSLAAATDVKLEFSQGTGAAHVVALFRAGAGQACDQNRVDCLNVGDKPTGTQTYLGLAAGNYWLVVQSYPGTTGSTRVTLSTGRPGTAEICNNGIDDDGDGAMDCGDLDCASASNCRLCVPDINLGTLVVGGGSKSATVDTTKGSNRYHPSRAGISTGKDIVVAFSVRETIILSLETWQLSGDHVYGLFHMPPAGVSCDDHESGSGDLGGGYYEKANWSFFPPGDYLIIFKARTAGLEGTVSITLAAYPNRGVEICDNDIDDDGDLLNDCADPDCYSMPICTALMCMPDGDLGDVGIGTKVSVNADLTTATKTYRTDCGRGDGLGRAYRVNLVEAMTLEFYCSQTGDHVLQIAAQTAPLDACDAHVVGCADPSIGSIGCSFGVPDLQPGVYFILVQAFSSGDEGKVSLTLRGASQRVLEICNNGIDDDGDGATDCNDRKCATDESCSNLRCRQDKDLGLLPLDGSPLSTAVETSGAGDDQKKSACVTGPGGADAVVRFDLPGDTNLTIEWAQVGNHALTLYKADTVPLPCEANTLIDCTATKDATTGTYNLPKVAAGRYYLVVDADKAGSEGGVILQVSGKAP